MQKFLILLAAIAFFTMDQLYASNVKGGKEVTITDPVNGNLYTAGGKINIQAPINGDLVCAGGEIRIAAPIGEDVLLGGGEVTIGSPVGGDLRLGGGKVILEANVGGDLVITGGELHVREGVLIGGDVFIAGGKVVFDGTVGGDVRIAGGEVIFNGKTSGKMDVKGGKIYLNGEVKGHTSLAARELNIGSNAAFYSNVQYWNEEGDANFEGHLYGGATANYNEDLKFKTSIDREVVVKGFMAFAAFRFVSAALLIVLLVSLFGRFFAKHSGKLQKEAGQYIRTGFYFWIGVPLLALLSFITVIGIPVGFILMSGYAVALLLANALTAVIATYELKHRYQKDWSKGIIMAISVGVLGALQLAATFPIPGKLLTLITIAIAVGAVIQWLRKGWQKADDTPNATPSQNREEPSDLV